MFATVTPGPTVEVSANRSDEEPGRLVRLNQILGFVHALASHYGNQRLLSKVISVHDHKGDLTVCWREKPTDGEMELFNRGWRDELIGDAWGPTEHTDESGVTYAHFDGPGMTYKGNMVPLVFRS